MSYKHKYYKYKQKYLNLLYGGVRATIQIRHKESGTPLTTLPFYRDVSYATREVLELPFVQTMPPEIIKQINDLLAQKQDVSVIRTIDTNLYDLEFRWNKEIKKDKENINDALLNTLKQQYDQLLQQKQKIETEEKFISDSIIKILRDFFIAKYFIVINGIHKYDFNSYVSMGGQGIIFRIINQETSDSHIIKFAIRNNCDEIKHEAEILTKYNKDYRQPIRFKPYLPIFYHDGVGAMGDMGDMSDGAMNDRGDRGDGDASSICFIVYEDVGYEDLNTFIRICRELISNKTNPQKLEDRIRMIPHILLQVALQLEYYKHYRHNDIRLQNIVVDVRPVSTATATPIYTGTILKLSRVTIIDFGLFNEPQINKFSLLYIASQEALEHKYEHTFSDNQNSDLIGFFWVAIELLTLSQIGNMIIEELIRHVLSNRENMSVIKKDILDIEKMINGKTLLFIYQLLMHNTPEKKPISGMFNGMVIDKEITFDTIFNLIKKHYNSKILEILFKNNRDEYGEFIRTLFKLLTPTSIRPSIERVIKWLRKQIPILVP